jgi:predicted helicase
MTKGKEFAHAFVTKTVSEVIFLSPLTGTNAFNFPIYIYPDANQQELLETGISRRPNFNAEIISKIEENLGLTFKPEKEDDGVAFSPIDMLDYIYAILYSPKYRELYAELLKIDFPRIPYPEDKCVFFNIVKLGRELRDLHLLTSPQLDEFITTYPIGGDNKITRSIGKYDYEITNIKDQLGRAWINDEQYFDGLPKTAWEFYIGGYQPAQKWLKDRKGKSLDHNEIFHYQKIVKALTETDRIMKEIDDEIDY